MKRALIIIAVCILLASFVSGIGIAPAHTDVNYEPGIEYEGSFRIINTEAKVMKVGIYAKGPLSDYVEFEKEFISFNKEESEKAVKFKLSFPKKMSPGVNTLEVFVVEVDQHEDTKQLTVVKTNLGLIHKINVYVPYPGQYLQGIMYISDAKPKEKVTFTVSLSSLGDKPIENIVGNIIITSDGEGVAQIKTDKISLQPQEKGKITADWIANVEPGTYHVQAVVQYDEKILVIEKDFDLGEALIDIKDIKIAQFKLGTIAKFDIMLENKWNSIIPNVKTETAVYNKDSTLLSKYESNSIDLAPLSKKEVSAYWDTSGINPNNYILTVTINYFGRKKEKSFEISVSTDKIEFIGSPFTGNVVTPSKSNFNVIPLFIVIVIGLSVFIFIVSRKKKVTVQKVQPVIGPSNREQIKRYIKYNMSQEISIKALKHKLVEKGYNETLIDEIILEVEEENNKI